MPSGLTMSNPLTMVKTRWVATVDEWKGHQERKSRIPECFKELWLVQFVGWQAVWPGLLRCFWIHWLFEALLHDPFWAGWTEFLGFDIARIASSGHVAFPLTVWSPKDDGIPQAGLFEADSRELHFCLCRAHTFQGTRIERPRVCWNHLWGVDSQWFTYSCMTLTGLL